MKKNSFDGGQIATRNIACVKEFTVKGGTLRAPLRHRNWGEGRKGRILAAKALRANTDCARGVHAWTPRYWHRCGFKWAALLPSPRVAWHCIIPKGTWYHIGENKFRADRIKMVREVKGSRA